MMMMMMMMMMIQTQHCVHIDVRGSLHRSMIHIKIQQDATMYQYFISYLYEDQHVSSDTPLIV
jgi:hypothetical protein